MTQLKFDEIVEAFEIVFQEDAGRQMVEWIYGDDIPLEFKKTGIYKSLMAIKHYSANDLIDLTNTGFEITHDGFCKYPTDLWKALQKLYQFWHKSLMYLRNDNVRKLTPTHRKISTFILQMTAKFRIDFGSTFSLLNDAENRYYFTYMDLANLANTSTKVISHKVNELGIPQESLRENPFTADMNPLIGFPELARFYSQFLKQGGSDVTFLNHSNAQYFLAKTRAYIPSRLEYKCNGESLLSYSVQANSYFSSFFNHRNVAQAAESIQVSNELIRDIIRKKKLKFSLSLLIRLDHFIFKTNHPHKPYKPFTII